MFPHHRRPGTKSTSSKRFRRLDLEQLEVRANPATYTVTSLGDVSDAGNNESALTLREAIELANLDQTPDTINFDSALTGGGLNAITVTLSQGRLRISSPLTIEGSSTAPISISGGSLYQVFYIDGRSNGPVDVSISDFYLLGGVADGSSGTTVADVDNSVRGGAVFNDSGNVTLTRVLMLANTAEEGSALYNQSGTLTLRDTTVTFNTAKISKSTSTGDAAVVNDGGTLTLIQSTVGNNTSAGSVGGIKNRSGALNLIQSTIVFNTATNTNRLSTYAGGVQTNPGGTTLLVNTVVDGNTVSTPDTIDSDLGGDASVDLVNSHHNLIGSLMAGGLANGVNSNIVDENALTVLSFPTLNGGLVPTYRPFGFGALINKGDDSIATTYGLVFDQRGFTRINGQHIEIGSVESGKFNTMIDLVSKPIPSRFGQPTTLTATMQTPNGVPTGTIQFTLDGANTLSTTSLDALGVATFITTSLPLGVHTVTATYAGDNLYNGSTTTITITVMPTKLEVDTLTDIDDGNWNPGEFSLREAVGLANSIPTDVDDITFASALTLFNPATIDLTTPLLLTSPMNILGPGRDRLTLSGNQTAEVIHVQGTTVDSTAVSVQRLTVTNGQGTNAGGIWNEIGDLTVVDAAVVANFADNGAGISVDANSRLTLTRTILDGNEAQFGGGGVLAGIGADVHISDSVFSNNVATVGAGLLNEGGVVTATNNSFLTNSALGGSGILNAGVLISVNNTLVGNDGDGAIYSSDALPGLPLGLTFLFNTLLAGNTDQGGPTALSGIAVQPTSSHNLIDSPLFAGGLIHGTNGNILGTDDGLGGRTDLPVDEVISPVAADNGGPIFTYALTTNSPAIDAGDSSLATVDGLVTSAPLVTDQRGTGYPRVSGPAVDIGAYEMHHLVVDIVRDEDDGVVVAGDLSLREALRLADNALGPALVTFASGIPKLELTFGTLTVSNDPSETRVVGPLLIRRSDTATNEFQIFHVDALANLTLDDLRIENGIADVGGGIESDGTLTLLNTMVRANHARTSGGGIYSTGALQVISSSIAENTAEGDGGGVAATGITLIDSSSLWGNYARGNGGAISLSNSLFDLTNSTISGNFSGKSGGGIYAEDSDLIITNGTIVQNQADADQDSVGNGGGFAVLSTGIASLAIYNTIVAGNTVNGMTFASDFTPGSVNIAVNCLLADPGTASGVANGANGNIVGKSDGNGGRIQQPLTEIMQPLLRGNGSLNLSHALIAGSPAIDAGDNSLASFLTADQRGGKFARIADGPDADSIATVDIGAFELGGAFQDDDLDQNGTLDVNDVLLNLLYYIVYAGPTGGSIATNLLPPDLQQLDLNGSGFYDTNDILLQIFNYVSDLGSSPGTPVYDPSVFAPAPGSPAPGFAFAAASTANSAPRARVAAAATSPVATPTPSANWDAALLLAVDSLANENDDLS